MPIDIAHLLGLDGGCVQEHAEFHRFIRSPDVAGTKSDHANGHHCKNATAIHDFTPPVLIRHSPDDRLIRPAEDNNLPHHWGSAAVLCVTAYVRVRLPTWVKIGKAPCEHIFSAVHPTTDIAKILRHVRFVPTSGSGRSHSMTSSARASNVGGKSRPSNLAVLRLRTRSYFDACSTGKSDGFSPLRILSM